MRLRTLALSGACALALSAVPMSAALAQFSGTLSGDYASIHVPGTSANSWGGNGQGTFGLGSNWSVELDAGYHNITASGANVDNWTVAGDAFWTGMSGRAGAQVGYIDTSGSGTSLHATNYGGIGEWWASPNVTVSGKAGGFTASGSTNGYYAGGAVTGYIHSNFSLSGGIDYTHIAHLGNETDYTAQGEYLVSQTTPISVFGGYTYSEITGLHINTWFVGLRFYCDGPGAGTLSDRQHTGSLLTTDNFGPAIFKF
jgi:hypothetical protein